ncbi:putative transcription factor p65 homolog [Centruroides vittatus]|uniref:putative transcription factor p65 homolog n=1 Tax=Centruroides vittatus TaxID=120091 RepID=UPI00350F80E8
MNQINPETVYIPCHTYEQNMALGEPEVVILEQPAPRTLRFRYECEGRLAGCITGINSTPENKTFPTIKIKNYKGAAAVIVSCVTKDPPYYPHPHNLVGKEGCKKGICSLEIKSADMVQSFTSLGIQCVKKKNIEASLNQREQLRVDPFRTGFEHKQQPNSIDLNVVRLAFQVILMSPDKTKKCLLKPVVSDPIYDKKAHSDLSIHKLSHYSAPVSGGTEVILLCEKVNKDVQIRFFEKKDGQEIWSANAEFQPSDIHKQVAISFITPSYFDLNVSHEVNVWIQLIRPSDNSAGKPRKFQLLPLDGDPEHLARKRVKFEQGCFDNYIREMTSQGATGGQGRGFPVPRQIHRGYRFNRVKPEIPRFPMNPLTATASSSAAESTQFIGDTSNILPFKKLNEPSSSVHPAENSLPISTTLPYSDYQRLYTSPSPGKQALETITPVSTAISYTGGALLHSFYQPNNNINPEFSSTLSMGGILSSVNITPPPPPLSDNSRSPPPLGGAGKDNPNVAESLPGSMNVLEDDLPNSGLQMSVDDATVKFDSLTIDFSLQTDTSLSGTNWFDLNPSIFDSGQNLPSGNGQTDENLHEVKKIERDLEELSQLCENTVRQSSEDT